MTDVVFWAAVQGIGTVLAAVAAIIALVIAGRQLGELIASNKLLAASNDAMTESNVALTRPYVVVDFEFQVAAARWGTGSTSVFVVVKNDGRTAAHNVTLDVDSPFNPISSPDSDGWKKSIQDLNRLADGSTILRSLSNARPVKYYLDGEELFGVEDEEAPSWTVNVRYEDAAGREYRDRFVLEVEPWRRSIAVADPLLRIARNIEAVAVEVKSLKDTLKPRPMTRTVRRAASLPAQVSPLEDARAESTSAVAVNQSPGDPVTNGADNQP